MYTQDDDILHIHAHAYTHTYISVGFNFDVLAQGNAYKPTMEPINYSEPSGDRTRYLHTEAIPPPASCPARSFHATEIVSKTQSQWYSRGGTGQLTTRLECVNVCVLILNCALVPVIYIFVITWSLQPSVDCFYMNIDWTSYTTCYRCLSIVIDWMASTACCYWLCRNIDSITFTVYRWIPRTKGQWRGRCFHLMTSSWIGWPSHSVVIDRVDLTVCCFCLSLVIDWDWWSLWPFVAALIWLSIGWPTQSAAASTWLLEAYR